MEKKSSQIIRENITYMINNDETTSMRNLSTSIGASDSFIQKILTEKANPSLEKIDLISEYFDVESWEMLYNFRKDNNDMLSILQMLQKLPASSMPVVKEFLAFLLKQFTDSSSHWLSQQYKNLTMNDLSIVRFRSDFCYPFHVRFFYASFPL